jgi:uncharacterized OsmC-like protein
MRTPLEELGYPLAFEVTDRSDLDAPPVRLDQAQRTRIRALSGMQKEALVTDTASGTTWRLVSDEGEYLDGDDIAPAPLAFLTTGMVSSFATELRTLADRHEVDLGAFTLRQDNYYTMSGSALRGTMAAGALPVELDVEFDGDADEDIVADLAETAVRTSPINGLLTEVQGSLFTLSVDGTEVDTGDATGLGGEPLDDPHEAFESLQRDAPEQDRPIIHRTGRETEPLPEADGRYTSGSGSSLEEEQDRVLHLRGVCSFGDDGVKTVEVKLFSPIGTVFQFRSDEPVSRGGGGRAPPAMVYVAAGLGFCFVTQIGRYADITDKPLDAYRIVQDTHFSFGTRERGEEPGTAAPVETHVFLETDEDDDAAQEILAMSEQTCFLHALCGADQDPPNVEVSRRG